MEFKDCVMKKMKLASLTPADYNPRTISDEAFKGLGRSMDKFGMLVPIVWNKRTGNIVGGHQRYKHLIEAGETETDVVVVDLDGNEEMALNITLNNPNVRGKFTSEVVNMLKRSEVQMGSLFNEIRLNDLFNSLKFSEKEPAVKSATGNAGSYDDGGRHDDVDSPPDAIITCPKCKSKWRLKDNAVVHNAMTAKREGEE